MTDPVQSVNITIALLLVGVIYALYWIMTYDRRS